MLGSPLTWVCLMFHHLILFSSSGHNSFILPPVNFIFMAQKIALSKSFPMSSWGRGGGGGGGILGVHIRSELTDSSPYPCPFEP